MKENLEKLVIGEAASPYGEHVNTKRLLEEERGYRALGMFDEAEAALREVMASDPKTRDYAQARLIHLLLGERQFGGAAALGVDLIARGTIDEYSIITTMLSLHHMGQFKEGRSMLLLLNKCGRRISDETYQMACFASRLGEFSDALLWLHFEFDRSDEYRAHSFGDTDLLPFWRWLGSHKPTLDEAHLMIQTPFKDACAEALDRNAPIQLSADDLAALPERQQRIFRFDFGAGRHVLSPLAAASDAQAAEMFERQRRESLEMVRHAIVEAHERAAQVVLDEQPRYAAEHAAWGNHLGARYHILWGLRYKPELMWRFLEHPRLRIMRPLLQELLAAACEDRGFFRRMCAVQECLEADPEGAMELLEETPELLHNTGLYRLRLGSVLHAQGKYEEALPIWIALCRDWPMDACGFSNAVACLIKLRRRWDVAEQLLEDSPACYRRFTLYWQQRAHLEGDEPKYWRRQIRPFRGQPDLGGELVPDSEWDPKDGVATSASTL